MAIDDTADIRPDAESAAPSIEPLGAAIEPGADASPLRPAGFQQLVEAAQRGDTESLTTLLVKVGKWTDASLHKRGYSYQDAQDVAQEVISAVIKRLGSFVPGRKKGATSKTQEGVADADAGPPAPPGPDVAGDSGDAGRYEFCFRAWVKKIRESKLADALRPVGSAVCSDALDGLVSSRPETIGPEGTGLIVVITGIVDEMQAFEQAVLAAPPSEARRILEDAAPQGWPVEGTLRRRRIPWLMGLAVARCRFRGQVSETDLTLLDEVDIHGRTSQDVAEQLAMTSANVRKRLSRVRKWIRDEFLGLAQAFGLDVEEWGKRSSSK